MRAYELMIIVDGDHEDKDVEDVLSRSTTTIEADGGTVAKVDKWGKRKFAYEINHKTEGFYAVLEITTEAQDLHDLDRQLRLADEVVRHKIIRLPEDEAERRGLLGDAPADVPES